MRLLRTYRKPIKLEVMTSFLLIFSTILALSIYNSQFQDIYKYVFNSVFIVEDFSLHMFINDFLMAIFFLVAGLEIKHELLYGSLSSFKKASFPVIASIGGVVIPALIFWILNNDTPFIDGLCIPISTDIAFAVGVFLIFRNKLNPTLKIFLLSLAVVDDLVSILAIGIFYSININYIYILISLSIILTLIVANKCFNIQSLSYYLISGLCLWYFIYLSGVHPTISGILLAITIPSSPTHNMSTLERLQNILVPINSLFIMPLFAFANTGISLDFATTNFDNANTLCLGIILGLCVGKPLGIMIFSFLGCLFNITEKPSYISWGAIFLVSLIAGIGFTMSLFISEIAFIHDFALVNIAKASILMSSIISIVSSCVAISIYDIYNKKVIINTTTSLSKYYIS